MSSKPKHTKAPGNKNGRVYLIDASGGRLLSVNPNGSDLKVPVTGRHRIPDGIVVDKEAGDIYWTEMGVPSAEDGSIERADIDSGNHITIVPNGKTFTPKQLQLDKRNGKLYWCDREGMRVMRSNLDGSGIETLVQTGQGEADRADPTRWWVGIAIDAEAGKLYWTQKGPDNAGLGRIFRAGLEIPKGESYSSRSDIELLFDQLPEPIDLDLDLEHRVLYWSDRGDPPRGNTVSRAPIDTASRSVEPEIVFTHLMEGNWTRARCLRRSDVHDRSGKLVVHRESGRRNAQDAARCSGESDRRSLRRLICSRQRMWHSRSGWRN